MDFCFCNITAFRILQRLESIPSVAYEPDSAAVLQNCRIPSVSRATQALNNLGITDNIGSMHVLLSNRSHDFKRPDISTHVVAIPLKAQAIFQLDHGIFCTSPEEAFLDMASSLISETASDLRCQAEAKLAFAGMELCGLYYRDANNMALKQRKAPLTTPKQIEQYLASCGRRIGLSLARKSLKLVEAGLRSPMEAAMSLLFCSPMRIGGYGLPRGEANAAVETDEGIREIDRLWRRGGIGYEYQGREYHGDDRRQLEDRRRNALLRAGVTIVNVWYEDISNQRASDETAFMFAEKLGHRLRLRNPDFRWKQHLLREVVLPSLIRFG